MSEKPTTHIAYAIRRDGQKVRWLEIGVASIRRDGSACDLFVDRLPVGGFNGQILVRLRGVNPEDSQGNTEDS